MMVHMSILLAMLTTVCGLGWEKLDPSLLVPKAPPDKVVVTVWVAKGCGPCRQMEPYLTRLQKAGYPIEVFDMGKFPDTAGRWHVEATPTLIMHYQHGKELGRQVGRMEEDELVKWCSDNGLVEKVPTKTVIPSLMPPLYTPDPDPGMRSNCPGGQCKNGQCPVN